MNYGFFHSICSNSYGKTPICCLWTFLFVISKVPELGDTIFIVLRKQRLTFLHWYHHITVLLLAWYSYADKASTARWYMNMNYLVHFIMYSYYALRANGISIPKPLAMVITSTQITQMILGIMVNFCALRVKLSGQPCAISVSTIYMGLLIYLSYFVLFANFFINSYLKTPKKVKKSQ